MMPNELPEGRCDITVTRPGLISMESLLPAGALQLLDIEARMEIEPRWRDPRTGNTSPTYEAGWDKQERAVITTEWKEATSG